MLLGSVRLSRFLLKVLEDQLYHLWIFNTGNDLNFAAAVLTDLNIDAEMTTNGQVRYELKTPYRNGTTHVIF